MVVKKGITGFSISFPGVFYKFKILFLICMIAAGLSACAPQYQPLLQTENRSLIDPLITYGVLPNGFQYVLRPNSIPEDRIDMHLHVFAGSVHEDDNQQGIAHYLEHMLFNGSTHFPPGDLIKYFQSIGMDFGADANAHTSFFNTVYDLSLPENDVRTIDEAFLVMEDYAGGALLLETEVDRERGIILAEKRQRDSTSYRTFKKSLEFELPGSILGRRFPIGTEDIIKKTGSSLLRSYYDRWYRPDNMALIVVGDFDVLAVKKMIEHRFSKLLPRDVPSEKEIPARWNEHTGIKAFYHYEPEAGSTDVTIETLSWEPFNVKTVEDLKRKTLEGIVNSIINNRLSRMVTSQQASFSDAMTFSGSFLHNVRLASISAECEPEKWQSSLSQLEYTLRQALEHGFYQSELERVKADISASLRLQVQQSKTQKTEDLYLKIASAVNTKGLLLSPEQEKEILEPYINSIALEEVNAAVKEIWSEKHRLVLITGNARIDGNEPENKILDVYHPASGEETKLYEKQVSKGFPYLDLPALEDGAGVGIKGRTFSIAEREDNAEGLGITRVVLNNNVQINVKKTDFKKNELLYRLSFGPGKKSEPVSKPGLSFLSGAVIDLSGLGGLDREQLGEALAGRNISIDFEVSENEFSFSGSCDPKEIELLFQLLYHYVQDPGLNNTSSAQKALELAKTRYRQDYESSSRTVEGMMKIKGTSFLAGGDPRFVMPEPEIIEQYTLDDIREWLQPFFNTSFLDLSMAGDIDLEKTIELARNYMGDLDARSKPETVFYGSKIRFPQGKKLDLNVDSKIKTAILDLSFPTDDFWDIRRTRRLSILSRIISERLRLIIREELGETYSPYAYNDPSTGFEKYGVMHVHISLNPESIGQVYDMVEKIVAGLSRGDISRIDIDTALNPVLNHIKTIRKTNGYWLSSVMANSGVYPQKLEWADSFIDDYSRINADEIRHLAKEYLRMDKSAVIRIKSGEIKE